ncbi:Leucine-rich repeat domain, L domain-like [Phytophthora cactorum]|nr:Leucine-rich repeat domain, L domain-like [Phytophthora cactorum]
MQKKRVRYLCDADRHTIIQRIEKGEKQADLAREYGVTRAAICHIKKNRDEIITRYDSLIRQAQEIHRTESFAEPEEDSMVREIQSSSVLLLMTTLRDRRSEPETFRRAAGRLIMMLLEEALSIIGVHSIEMTTATGYVTYGLGRTDEFCGVAIGAEGFPFLVLFHQMEPDASQGSIHVKQETDEQGASVYRLNHVDLPSDIARLEAICNRFPGVRIITSGIDSKVDPETQAIIPGLGDFITSNGHCSISDIGTVIYPLGAYTSSIIICDDHILGKRYQVEVVATVRLLKVMMDSAVLLQAVAGVARAVRSLYGPNKLRKQVTVTSVLQSQNAGTSILQQALDDQRQEVGTGCTTMVSLCGVLAETVLELLRQGLPTDIILQAVSSAETCCLTTAKYMRIPLAEAVPSFQKLHHFALFLVLIQQQQNRNDFSDAPLCIPVSSYNSLRQLAEMSGAEIVDSWDELLPNAIGHECLQMKTLEFSHVSVIVQGPTKSLAEELRNETIKVISRLRNALRSGYVLPGNGGFWCACAAAVKQEAKALASQELLSFATARLMDSFTQLGVILVENSDVENDSFFSRLARVRTVQKRFQWMHYFEAQSHHIDVAMAATSPTAGAGSPKKAGMPRRQTAVVPLDYSFMGLTSLSEMQQHDPVCGTKKVISVNALTTRSRGGAGDGLASPTGVKVSTTAGTSPTKKRQTPVSLRVNNNKISSLNDMQEALCAVFDYPEMLQWLDLSGNVLSSIPPDVFSAYPDLFTLHLHGNQLSKYSDIDALAKWLPRLHSISLHGNPLEEKKHYRNYVISSFPNLKQLNFSSVTLGDRDKAETWTGIYKNARNGGKSRDDDL